MHDGLSIAAITSGATDCYYFRTHPPKTLAQACAKIEELTGLVRIREQVLVFLKSLRMSCRRVGVLPAKADVEAQEEFVKKN